MRSRILAGAALAITLAIGGAAAASAQTGTSLSASPDSITVGESSKITATDLGGLETAQFGLDATPGGSLSATQASVSNGEATVDFTSTETGTFTVTVGDGENVLATTTVTVTAGGSGGGSVATVEAAPASITVGAASTITASGLGQLASANFGLDGTPGGSLSADQASVTTGSASVEFTATEPGTFTIAVSDGETVLGTTTVTVTAAPTPTPSPSATPAADGGLAAEAIWIIVILALLIVAAVVTIIVLARKRSTKS
ncbi:hypothetical protein QL996_02920 [Planococcus sp. APC 4015]|nr:hypothetical protein [Planococcus sp. APC 4015]